MRTHSIRSFDDPCGSWQVAQFSRTGACSKSVGSAHLGVTAGARLGDGVPGLQRLDVGDRAVRVVARRARHLALAHRHVGHRALGLRDLQTMTGGAGRGLGRLRELMLRRRGLVHAVAGGAGEVARLVRAAFPARVGAAVVAREAGRVHLGRLERAEPPDIALGVVVDVGLAGPVAALAAERGGRRPEILDLPVLRAPDVRRTVVMAERAGVGAGVAGRWRRLCRGEGDGRLPELV